MRESCVPSAVNGRAVWVPRATTTAFHSSLDMRGKMASVPAWGGSRSMSSMRPQVSETHDRPRKRLTTSMASPSALPSTEATPSVTSAATASGRTSVTVVGKPRRSRWRAMGAPMSPRPTKPTGSGSLTGAPRGRAGAGVLDDELAPGQREGVGPGEHFFRVLVPDVLDDALVLTGEVPVLLPVVVQVEHEPVEHPPAVGAGEGRGVVEDA